MSAEFTAESVNSDIRSMVVNTIEGVTGSGSIKSRVRDAARLLGLPVVRVRDYYYNRVRRIEAHEAFQIIRKAEAAERLQFERMRISFEARRLARLNSVPSRLAFLVPPAVEPLPDFEDGADPIKGTDDEI